MSASSDIAQQITHLREQCQSLEAELRTEEDCTRTRQEKENKALDVVSKLRTKASQTAAARDSQGLLDEQARLDAEAITVAAVRQERAECRAKVAEVRAQTRATVDSVSARIAQAVARLQAESDERVEEFARECRQEKDVLDQEMRECQEQLGIIRSESAEVKQKVSHLKKRTAVARFARAAAAWHHRLLVKKEQQTMRRTRAGVIRKLSREIEEYEQRLTEKREALNREAKQDQEVDAKARRERKDELQGLEDELDNLEDQVENLEERLHQKQKLSDAVNIAPLAEGDRIRQWAEAVAGAGSANFREASLRLNRRVLAFDPVEEEPVRARGGKKLKGSKSAPTLPAIQGHLQGLEQRIQGCRPKF